MKIHKTIILGAVSAISFFGASTSAYAYLNTTVGGIYTSSSFDYDSWMNGSMTAATEYSEGTTYYTYASATTNYVQAYYTEVEITEFEDEVTYYTYDATTTTTTTTNSTNWNRNIVSIGYGSTLTQSNATKFLNLSTLNLYEGSTFYSKGGYFGYTATNASSAAKADVNMYSSSLFENSGGYSSIGNFVMNGDATYSNTGGTATIASLSMTTGDAFNVSKGTVTISSTTINGNASISLTLDSLTGENDLYTAAVLGSLDLGTLTFTNDTVLTIFLDVSGVEITDSITVALTDFFEFSTEDDLSENIEIDLVGNDTMIADVTYASGSYTVTFSTAAVPEPSTYAMIFGVVALGFAAYRRRKQ